MPTAALARGSGHHWHPPTGTVTPAGATHPSAAVSEQAVAGPGIVRRALLVCARRHRAGGLGLRGSIRVSVSLLKSQVEGSDW
jgi:hypothetical protein